MKILKESMKAKSLLTVFLTIVIIIIGCFIYKKVCTEKHTKLDTTDQKMFDELTLQYKTFDQSANKLWTASYQYNKEPLILIRSDKNKSSCKYIYLINASKWIDTKKYKKINFPDNLYLDDVYRATSLGKISKEYSFPAAFFYSTLANKEMLAFKYYPELFNKGYIFPDFSYFSVHEAFHLYVQKSWIYDQNAEDHIDNYPYNKESFDLLRKEYTLLDEGLKTRNIAKLDTIMKQWIEIRDIRYKKWPQLIAEKNSEAIEGTARYLEYRYSDLTKKNRHFITDDKGKIFTFSQGLELVLENEAYYTFLERDASYDRGAALGYILDKLDPSWKQKIEDSPKHRGLTQYEILKSRYSK